MLCAPLALALQLSLNLLTSVMPLVNIAMAGYSLLDIITDIRTQNAAIERIYERIEEEFVQDRMANLVAALETGELWDKVNDPAYKRDHIGRMTDRLHEAVAHLREDFQDVLSFESSPENLARALRFQVLLIHLATMIVRGYMEINEGRLALEWLSSIMRGRGNGQEDLSWRCWEVIRRFISTNRSAMKYMNVIFKLNAGYGENVMSYRTLFGTIGSDFGMRMRLIFFMSVCL